MSLSLRFWFKLGALSGIIGLVIWLLSLLLPLRLLDFEHYLEATRLICQRQNPYGAVEFFAPPWLALLIFPLSGLPPQVASSIWLLVLVGASAVGVSISLQWLGQTSRLRRVIFTVLIPTAAPAVLYCYVTGQITPLVNTMIILSAWKISSRSRWWVSVLGLLFVSVKPHVIVLPWALSVLEAVRRRQWHVVVGVMSGLLGLAVLSFLWRADWLAALLRAWSEGHYRGGRPGLVSPGYTGLNELGIPSLTFVPLVIYLLWQGWRWGGLHPRVFALALASSLLIVPYSRSYDLVVLIFPLLYLAGITDKRDGWIFAGAILSFFILPLTSLSVITPVIFVAALLIKKHPLAPDVRAASRRAEFHP